MSRSGQWAECPAGSPPRHRHTEALVSVAPCPGALSHGALVIPATPFPRPTKVDGPAQTVQRFRRPFVGWPELSGSSLGAGPERPT